MASAGYGHIFYCNNKVDEHLIQKEDTLIPYMYNLNILEFFSVSKWKMNIMWMNQPISTVLYILYDFQGANNLLSWDNSFLCHYTV